MAKELKRIPADSFSESMDWVEYTDLNESSEKSVVDGVHVLARVKGPFFKVGESLNKRYYSRALWEKTLSKIKEGIENGQMVGTVGHEQEINDEAFAEGKISHRVSNAYLGEDGIGIGEALIFNTEAGRNLNTYFRAGVGLGVSTRAFGKDSGVTKTKATIIDEDEYHLVGWDFVKNPGIIEALPTLVENISNCENIGGGIEMSEHDEIIRVLTTEKNSLSTRLGEMASELGGKTTEIAALKEEVEEKGKEVNTLTSSLEKLKERLSTYEDLGTPKELSRLLETSKTHLSEAREALEKYKELGEPEEVTEALGILESYVEIGSLDDINRAFDLIDQMMKKTEEERVLGEAKELSSKCGVSEERAAKLIETLGKEEAEKFLGDLTENISNHKIVDRYKVNNSYIDTLREDTSSRKGVNKSRASIMFQQMS